MTKPVHTFASTSRTHSYKVPAFLSLFAGLAVAALPAHFLLAQPVHIDIPTTQATSPAIALNINILVPQVPRRAPLTISTASHNVTISAVNADVTIDDQVATTVLTFTLTNSSLQPQEAQIFLPVPDAVAVRSLQYDGVGPEPKAEVLPRDQARAIYDLIVHTMRDPALVEFVGYNLIKTSAFPVPPGASQKLTLTYEQALSANADRVEYILPRSQNANSGSSQTGFSQTSWTIKVVVNTTKPLELVHSTSHFINIDKSSPNRAIITVSASQSTGPFRLSYATQPSDPNQLAYSLITYPDPILVGANSPGGYFMLVAAPPKLPAGTTPAHREVVLVLDRSGSMRGEKWTQAQNAAIQVVSGLREGEFFNIIDYSNSIASYSASPIAKSATTSDAAGKYVQSLEPNGGTNIHDALLEALRPEPTANALPMILFLTDGIPTIGERSEVRIRDAAKAANLANRRIFTFGVGQDLNFPLISALSTNSRGLTTIVDPGEDVEQKVSQVFRRLNGPVLTSPAIASTSKDNTASTSPRLRELLPPTLPDVFEGDQLIVLGQYTGNQPFNIIISGSLSNTKDSTQSWTIAIDPETASTRNGFVPRLWATRKIGLLADQARQLAAEPNITAADPRMKELVDEIVRLSIRFGILSEYTSFLAREQTSNVNLYSRANVDEANANVQRYAGKMRSGTAGAAQQADLYEKQTMPSAVAASVAPTWRNLENKVESTQNVRNIAANSFFFQNNTWVDSRHLARNTDATQQQTEAQTQIHIKPDQTIAFGSLEYSTLCQTLATKGEQYLLAQAGNILLFVDNKAILITEPTNEPAPTDTP